MAQITARFHKFITQLIQLLRDGAQPARVTETGLPSQKNRRYYT